MKDTRIVFAGIAVLLLLPVLFQGVKNIWSAANGKNIKDLWIRFLAVLVIASAIILFIVSLYRFTIGYQAPLVAEQFHEMFVKRVNRSLSQEEFLNALKEKDLTVSDFVYVKDEDINSYNFVHGEYSVALSENIYNNDDGTITLYARYQGDGEEIYTVLTLNMNNNRWRAVEHKVLTGDELENENLKRRFYEIKLGR